MDRESILRLGEAYNQVVNEDWRDLLKGTPLGRPYTDKEKEAIRQGLKTTNDKTIDKQGIERALSTDSAMTQDAEDSRTNIPRTDKEGNRIYTDADRPGGYHDIEVNGQQVKRFWDKKNKKWRVDPNDRFTMGTDKPQDERAKAIRSLSQGGLGPGGIGANDGTTDLGDNINSFGNRIRGWVKDNTGLGPGRVDRFGQPVKDGEAANDLEREGGGRQRALDVADDKMKGGDGSSVPNPIKDTEVETKPDTETETEVKTDDVTQKGPNSAGLTPMQQWAKKFPKLAAKVKPGQAGYDDIQKMNSPASQASASVKTPQMNTSKVQNNTQQAFGNSQINKVSQPIARGTSKLRDAADKMNKAASPNPQSFSRTPKKTPTTPTKPMTRLDKATSNVGKWEEEVLADLMADFLGEGRGLAAGKDDYDKMRERNANAGHTPGNTYATAQRRMRSGVLRGQKKQPGVKVPKPAHLTPAQELAHRTGMTKARLAQKHSGTAAGRRQIANNAMDAAELGGSKNNRGS